jgi:peptidoglycan hydrolase-like protein with peptidoglycan-binding domain
MSFALTWMADALLQAGLKVAPVAGWEQRGRRDMGAVLGVLCHHTAGPRSGNMPSLATLIEGRPGLQGPLAQLGLGRDGTFYLVAAGLCNHAGSGVSQGITAGNTHLIGIEAENTGLAGDPWPEVQIKAYQHGAAALLRHIGRGSAFCIGHKEWAPGRKSDPSFDVGPFRAAVEGILSGGIAPLAPIPFQEQAAASGQATPRPTLRRGMVNEFVKPVQRQCGLPDDGWFGALTEAAVRQVQRDGQLVDDGIVGPKTWLLLDALTP